MADKFVKLNKMSKEQLVAVLKPLIRKAVAINNYWLADREGRKTKISEVQLDDYTMSLWVKLTDLHDDFGREP